MNRLSIISIAVRGDPCRTPPPVQMETPRSAPVIAPNGNNALLLGVKMTLRHNIAKRCN
jgi:hypothetical protein